MPLYSLTHDGLLHLRAPDSLMPRIDVWLPLHAAPSAAGDSPLLIDVVASQVPLAARGAPDIRFGSTAVTFAGDVATLTGLGCSAHMDLAAGRVLLHFDPDSPVDVTGSLTLCTALLLARRRRYLMHCAAVVRPDGGAWLLAGDTRAGKTSTSLNLARAGWTLLADDHVVAEPAADGGWLVEGWPRRLHPDAGWREGVITGVRAELHPRDAGLDLGAPMPLETVLLPRVVQGATITQVAAASHATALAMVLRQSAWSVADPAGAATALRDIADFTRVPALELTLARDSFANPAVLERAVLATTA